MGVAVGSGGRRRRDDEMGRSLTMLERRRWDGGETAKWVGENGSGGRRGE